MKTTVILLLMFTGTLAQAEMPNAFSHHNYARTSGSQDLCAGFVSPDLAKNEQGTPTLTLSAQQVYTWGEQKLKPENGDDCQESSKQSLQAANGVTTLIREINSLCPGVSERETLTLSAKEIRLVHQGLGKSGASFTCVWQSK